METKLSKIPIARSRPHDRRALCERVQWCAVVQEDPVALDLGDVRDGPKLVGFDDSEGVLALGGRSRVCCQPRAQSRNKSLRTELALSILRSLLRPTGGVNLSRHCITECGVESRLPRGIRAEGGRE
eukprot:1883095-Rhodomonas_salina.1